MGKVINLAQLKPQRCEAERKADLIEAIEQLRETIGEAALQLFFEAMQHVARSYDLEREGDLVAAEAATKAAAATRDKLRMQIGKAGIIAMSPALQSIFDAYEREGCRYVPPPCGSV